MMKRQYVYGETLHLWGKAYELQVFRFSRNSVLLRDGKVMMTVRSDTTIESRERQIREWYRKLLSAEIDRLLPKWETITGISCNSWQTRKMTTRWGTCNITERKIWFSLQLAKRPVECLEFIIIHELTHLVHKKHGVEFDAFVEKHMPNWRDYDAMLSTPLNDDWVEAK
jgi:predicted metal-dependent hydrolase